MGETRTVEFQAEVRQLLDIVIHSLYSNKEVFLRELISNASDALDKRRFLGLQDETLRGENLGIRITPDPKARTISIRDGGIGMTEAEVHENIGTIARSGTRGFLEQLKQAGTTDRPGLIGQFGVGFYSAFMVAERVVLRTRKAGTEGGVLWQSSGDGTYAVTPAEVSEPGTEIILHLRQQDKEAGDPDFADPFTIQRLIKKYSDFITWPIRLITTDDKGDGKEEVVNSMKAIWTRPRSEVKDEEYHEYYRQISHDFSEPMETIYFNAEGKLEYRALLFIPSRRPMDLMYRDGRRGLNLYVRQVFIMGDCEKLLPQWLRFVRGTVDSADLSLNVSRELLQQDRQIEAIRKRLTRKVLDTLLDMRKNRNEQYLKFWTEFGDVLKEGAASDFSNASELKDLLLFRSTKSDELTSLEDYVARMPAEQTEIYYLTAPSLAAAKASPFLEALREKGREVLLAVDPVDEFAMPAIREYKEKKLKAVNRGDLDLKDGAEQKTDEKKESDNRRLGPLLKEVQLALSEEVKEVRLSDRLRNSPACLVGDEGAPSPQMEQLMRSMGQEVPKQKRILELNPDHPAVAGLAELQSKNAADSRIAGLSRILLGQAMLAEGVLPSDPAAFCQGLSDLMTAALAAEKKLAGD